MACGLPCIISDASSLPEVGGDAAIQLSPANESEWTEAMLDLLADPEKQARMSKAGIVQSRAFSWNKAARELMQIYNSLLTLA
jgi:glycosyltransferase involved in cell wall biosynthesis